MVDVTALRAVTVKLWSAERKVQAFMGLFGSMLGDGDGEGDDDGAEGVDVAAVDVPPHPLANSAMAAIASRRA